MKDQELQALLTQYEAIRAEINLATNSQNNIINYSIALIAGLFILLSLRTEDGFFIIYRHPVIVSGGSILLILMTWSVLEAEMAIHDLRAFIHNKLSKRIRECIELATEKSDYFKMEIAQSSDEHKWRSYIRGIMVSAKFMISFFRLLFFSFYLLL